MANKTGWLSPLLDHLCGFSTSFRSSVRANAQVFFMAFVGLILGFFPLRDPYVSRPFVRKFSNLALDVFLPCLSFYSTASRLTLSHLQYLWPLFVWSIFQCVMANVISNFLLSFYTSQKDQRVISVAPLYHVLPIALTFQNTSVFPLTILEAFCEQTAEPAACFGESAMYLFVYSVPWSIIFWMAGYPRLQYLKETSSSNALLGSSLLLRSASGNIDSKITTEIQNERISHKFRSLPTSSFVDNHDSSRFSTHGTDIPVQRANLTTPLPAHHFTRSACKSVSLPSELSTGGVSGWLFDSPTLLSPSACCNEKSYTSLYRLSPTGFKGSTGSKLDFGSASSRMSLFHFCGLNFANLRNLSSWIRRLYGACSNAVIGIILGITVGITPPLKRVFFDKGSVLESLTRVIHVLGQPAVPCMTIILAASLAHVLKEISEQRVDENAKRILQEPNENTPLVEDTTSKDVYATHCADVTFDNGTSLVLDIGNRKNELEKPNRKSVILGSSSSFDTLSSSSISRQPPTLGLIVLAVSFRIVLIPILGICSLLACIRFLGNSSKLLPDIPFLRFVILMEFAVPSSQTVVIACQRLGMQRVAGHLAIVYLWMYLCSFVTCTMFCFIGALMFLT